MQVSYDDLKPWYNMALYCAQNILSTYILQTKTIQPNFLNQNHF